MNTVLSLKEFLAVGLLLAITPGPNMMYVLSRAVVQGRRAGLVSLAGVMVGYLFYMLAAALGITAVVVRIPHALTLLTIAGALYLAYLAWQSLRPGGRSPFEVQPGNAVQSRRLLLMGATTSLLNPKLMMIFVSLVPRFVDYPAGNVLGQTLMLGSMLIIGFATSNGLVALFAGSLSAFMTRRRRLLLLQRMLTGCVLAILSLRMLQDVLPAGLLVDLLMLGQSV